MPRFATRYSRRRAPNAALVLVACTLLASCRDAAPTRSLGVAPQPSPSVGALPSLRPSATVMPAASPGGTMPAIPSEWNASIARLGSGRFSASVSRPSSAPISSHTAPGRGIAASVSSTGLPFVRHILLENTTTGDRAAWVIGPSGQITQAVGLGNLSTAWHMAGMGDFNGDGYEDILWENTSDGTRAIWFLNGSGGVIAAVSLGVVPTVWNIAGAGDFLGTGQEDILWENTTTGDRVVWLMNGSTVTAAVTIGTLDPLWHMIAADNLCGDNKDDILLENTSTGSRVLWCMNGLQVASALTLGTLATPTWRMAGTGDIDGDGNNDILWENTVTGARVAWLLNGVAGVTAAVTLTTEVPAWRITGVLIPQTTLAVVPSTVVIRVVSTDPAWGQETTRAWPGAAPVKDTIGYSLYDLEIGWGYGSWPGLSPTYVSLFKFVGGRDAFNYLTPSQYEAKFFAGRIATAPLGGGLPDYYSGQVLGALKAMVTQVLQRERPVRLVIEFSGHGGPTTFFQGALQMPDARLFAQFVRQAIPGVPFIFDFSTNCNTAYFDFAVNFYDSVDYLMASEREVGGFDPGDVSEWMKYQHDNNLHVFWQQSHSLDAVFDATVAARQGVWENARTGIIASHAEQSLGVYDLSKFRDLMNALAADQSFDPMGLYAYSGDIGTYVYSTANASLTSAFEHFRVRYVSDRSILPWTELDTRGFSVAEYAKLRAYLGR